MLLICTALFAEAKPLIQHFKLKPCATKKGFKIWENDSIRLVVTGTGKTLASAGCSYLFALTPEYSFCLNVGIGGHQTLPVGTPFLAHKVSENTSIRSFYPSIVFETPCSTYPVVTVDKAQKDLSSDLCYDMEAFGFCSAAGKFLPFELIHCFKVISDNQQNPFLQVTEKKVSSLIEQNIPVLETVIEHIKSLAEKYEKEKPEDMDLSFFEKKWHFTVSEKYLLKDILEKMQSLSTPTEIDCLETCTSSKEVLKTLEKQLHEAPLVL